MNLNMPYFCKNTYLYNNHRQRVHVGLIRRFPLHPLDEIHGVEELRGTVPDRAARVGG